MKCNEWHTGRRGRAGCSVWTYTGERFPGNLRRAEWNPRTGQLNIFCYVEMEGVQAIDFRKAQGSIKRTMDRLFDARRSMAVVVRQHKLREQDRNQVCVEWYGVLSGSKPADAKMEEVPTLLRKCVESAQTGETLREVSMMRAKTASKTKNQEKAKERYYAGWGDENS